MKRMKWYSILSLMLAFLLVVGCSSTSNSGGSSSSDSSGSKDSGSSSSNQPVQKQVKLTAMVGNAEDTQNIAKALIAAFEAKNPHIKIEIETAPGGTEGDNLLKTRLATGDMTDIFFYNSGSLLQAINPEQNILDITDEPFQDNVEDSFKPVVSYNGRVYGVPYHSAGVGGWFYNKKVYEELGLSIPKTWDELMNNLEIIKNEGNGIAPVIGTFKDTWTSQLIVLSDYYNVQVQEPNFADDYTANKAKFATSPAALRSFEKMQDLVGYLNVDYLATTLDAGIKMLTDGEGAHYPMLSLVIPTILQNTPEKIEDIGFFGQPGDDPNHHGITVWMPNAVYIYKNTEHVEEAKAFLGFIASAEGMETVATVSLPTGPFVVKDVEMPEETPKIVIEDMMPYIENGKNAPALEFLSPVKGPSLENLVISVGSGQMTAEEAAEAYDKDVEKQALQLGLEGW